MSKIINIEALARHIDAPADQVRAAGAILFSRLAGAQPDLTKAVVAASAATKIETGKLMLMLDAVVEGFHEPAESGTFDAISAGFSDFSDAASDRFSSASASVRDAVNSIELGDVKESGEKMLSKVREDISSIDVAQMKDKALAAGGSLLERARSLAPGAKGDATSPEADPSKD